MGLFKRGRSKEAVDVGSAICGIDDAGHGFVAQQYHAAVTSTAIAALAPITFALNMAYGFASRSNADAQRWMDSVVAFGDAAALTSEVNYSGVVPLDKADKSAVTRAVAIGKFRLLPSSNLVGTWSPQGSFDPEEDSLPLLGVLMAAAIWEHTDGVVWHGLDVATSSSIDYSNTGVMMELPQKLLDYGAQQSGLDNLEF